MTFPKFTYKYVSTGLVDRVRSGESIRLGTYRYYRNLEHDRADREEGATIHRANGEMRADDPAARQLQKLIRIEGGGAVKFDDFQYIGEEPDHLIFCTSKHPDHEYAAVNDLRILQVEIAPFVQELLDALPELGMAKSGWVTYDKADADLLATMRAPYRPFSKPDHLSWEEEYRTVFDQYESKTATIDLYVPEAAQFMQLLPK